MADIIAVTRQVIAEKGYDNVFTTEVASRCGISEGTIFRYFETKRDLLRAVAEDWFAELISSFERRDNKDLPIFDRLRQVIWESLSIIRQERSLSRFILMELRADPAYKTMRIYALNRRYTSRVFDVIDDALRSGEFRQDISKTLIRSIVFGSIEHQTWAYLRGENGFNVEQAADQIASVVYEGMKSRAPARKAAIKPARKRAA